MPPYLMGSLSISAKMIEHAITSQKRVARLCFFLKFVSFVLILDY